MDEQGQAILGGATSGALAGASFGPIGAGIGGVIGAGIGALKPKRPKYTVRTETDENKALAAQTAFGLNPSVARGLNMADQTAAEDINTAQQYTNNTGSILNVLRSINSTRNATGQNLMAQNSQLNLQGKSALMGANKDAIDENDKGWNYNVNQPYQNAVAANRDILKGGTENFWRLLDSLHAQNLLKSNTIGDTGDYSSKYTGFDPSFKMPKMGFGQ